VSGALRQPNPPPRTTGDETKKENNKPRRLVKIDEFNKFFDKEEENLLPFSGSMDKFIQDLASLYSQHGLDPADAPRDADALLKRASLRVTKQPLSSSSLGAMFNAPLADTAIDTPLGRLEFRYAKRLREIELPESGFSSPEQAAAAARLSATYRSLRKLQIELGLPVTPKSWKVTAADRLRVSYQRSEKTPSLSNK
jgi:hypothetical protein